MKEKINPYSAIFIPWQKIKYPSFFNGCNFNFKLPIYWADFPVSMNPSERIAYVLEKEDLEDEHCLIDIARSVIRNKDRLVVFGTKDLLQNILYQFKRVKLITEEKNSLLLYYGQKTASEKTNRYYVQCNDTEENLEMLYFLDEFSKYLLTIN